MTTPIATGRPTSGVSATRLIEKLRQDQALAKRFKDAGEAGCEAMARQQGLECTGAEMREAIEAAGAGAPIVGIYATVV